MASSPTVTLAVRTSVVCAAVNVAPSTLAYWIRVRVVSPSVIGSTGKRYERWWSLQDVMAVRAVKALRESGCPLQKVREAVRLLEKSSASLHSTRLVWDGQDVFLQDQWGSIVSAIRKPGQLVLHTTVLPLGQWEAETSAIAEEVAVRSEKRRRRESRSSRTETTRLSS
ncbi:MerR family transcriptional regulator [Nocardioides dongkuii]|uniref:helix-turn-helix domain-containing protein n=1 Tax=Nocardioides dongkuii TaxID=2760089 RepID=UPI003CC8305E